MILLAHQADSCGGCPFVHPDDWTECGECQESEGKEEGAGEILVAVAQYLEYAPKQKMAVAMASMKLQRVLVPVP